MLWLNFFDGGLTLGLKNKLTESISRNDVIRGKELVSTTYFLMLMIIIPLLFCFQLFLGFFNFVEFLNVDPIYKLDIEYSVRFMVFFFCLQMVFNIISVILAADQKVALSSAFPMLGNVISLLIIILLRFYISPSLTIMSVSV